MGREVAAAYRESFDEFTRENPDIEVRLNVVAYSSYFDTLRTDVAGGGADDVFWLSNAYFAGYADNGKLLDVGQTLGPDASSAWDTSVVKQFTRNGVLWAVPQLTDAGIAVYYNSDLLQAAGIDARTLVDTALVTGRSGDTLRPLLTRLTVDADGNHANTTQFDPDRIRQWGYNAANDLQGIYLNFIGSAGGVFRRWGPVRLRQSLCGAGFRLPGPADQRRSRRTPGIGHQWQRRLLAQPVPAGQDGAIPVGHLQLGGDRGSSPIPLGRCHDAELDRQVGSA